MQWILRIDTFENDAPKPIVTHIFYGKTQAQAEAVLHAHMQTDAFLNAALTTGNFQGIKVTARRIWAKRI